MNLRMRLHNINLVLKVHRAVTLNLKLLLVGFAHDTVATHVDEAWEEFVLGTVDHREGVDGDQDLVAVAVDPHRVVVVLVLINCWSEFDIDILSDTCGDHSLLLTMNLEV